jgi:restriction system protein
MNKIPTREQLMAPLINALIELGGSGNNQEINEKVIGNLKIPTKIANKPHKTKNGINSYQSHLEYELAWVRTTLKAYGLVENSTRGVWSLLNKNIKESDLILNVIPNLNNKIKKEIDSNLEKSDEWKGELIQTILDELDPSAFERLTQRLLRESGFVEVEVTGRTGDKGIDGKGIARINGILSFHVIFQCKRYKNTVGSKEIRDFRGAMDGRTNKGLFITTGKFTRGAVEEATREGASTIDLVDGDHLAEKLKSLGLGVKVEIVEIEKVIVDKNWFKTI